MRNKHLPLTLAALLLLPALTGAATLDQLTATADCNAWNSEVTIAFRPGATTVLLVFSMQLADSAGVEIERFDYEEWLEIPATELATYPFGAAWQAPLGQPAVMSVTADVYDTRGDSFGVTGDGLNVSLDCATTGGDDVPVEVCRHASRWWLRQRADWPVDTMNLGGVSYDRSQLERLLRQPHRGLLARRVAHQLAVAKLNLANGVTDDIGATVAAADAWLMAHPLESRGRHREPRHNERRAALRLIKDLCQWNHGGCPDGSLVYGDDEKETGTGLTMDFSASSQQFGAAGGEEFTGDLADYETTEKAAEEATSLGTLKAMFR